MHALSFMHFVHEQHKFSICNRKPPPPSLPSPLTNEGANILGRCQKDRSHFF